MDRGVRLPPSPPGVPKTTHSLVEVAWYLAEIMGNG
jgi:hypothetical protein